MATWGSGSFLLFFFPKSPKHAMGILIFEAYMKHNGVARFQYAEIAIENIKALTSMAEHIKLK